MANDARHTHHFIGDVANLSCVVMTGNSSSQKVCSVNLRETPFAIECW